MNEAAMIDNWFATLESRGYDTAKISYGKDVFESLDPEFGMPCECVDVKVPLKNEVIHESYELACIDDGSPSQYG